MFLELFAIGLAKAKSVNTTKVKSAEELRKSVVGVYQAKMQVGQNTGRTTRMYLLENGAVQGSLDGKKDEGEFKWKIQDRKVRVETPDGVFPVVTITYRIELNGDLTMISMMRDGKQLEMPKDKDFTFKKIK